MNSAERKILTHSIAPGVQRIMRVQSEPLRSQALIELHQAGHPIPLKELETKVHAVLGEERTSLSTLAHVSAELDEELLVSRIRRGAYGITLLGSAAVEAQREYQATLLPVVTSDRVRILGGDLAAEISQLLLENSRRTRTVAPWILDTMLEYAMRTR